MRDPGDHYIATPGNPAYTDLYYSANDVSYAFAGLILDWTYPSSSGPLDPLLRADFTVEWVDTYGGQALTSRHSSILTFDSYN